MLGLLRQKLPQTQLLMLGILPRGDGTNSSSTYTWPGIYTPAFHSVNAWLEDKAKKIDKIHYLDCGPMLLFDGKVSPMFCGLIMAERNACLCPTICIAR